MKTNTTTRFSARLNRLVSTTASGITSPGTASCGRPPPGRRSSDRRRRRLLEEAEQHDVEQQQDRIVRHLRAEPEDLREDRQQHAEEHQRARDRPQVAERGPEVGLLEVGDGDQVEQLERSAPAAAERRGAGYVAQLGVAVVGHGAAASGRLDVGAHRHAARPGFVPVDEEVEEAERVQRQSPGAPVARDPAVDEVAPGSSGFSIVPDSRTRSPAATRPICPRGQVGQLNPNTGAPSSLRKWKPKTGSSRSCRASKTTLKADRLALLDVVDPLARPFSSHASTSGR